MHMHRSSSSTVFFLPGQVPGSSIRLYDESSFDAVVIRGRHLLKRSMATNHFLDHSQNAVRRGQRSYLAGSVLKFMNARAFLNKSVLFVFLLRPL